MSDRLSEKLESTLAKRASSLMLELYIQIDNNGEWSRGDEIATAALEKEMRHVALLAKREGWEEGREAAVKIADDEFESAFHAGSTYGLNVANGIRQAIRALKQSEEGR